MVDIDGGDGSDPELYIMNQQPNTFPSLTKSFKNYYPFKIGTTSFIYPDLYVPNVERLGAFVDEIELLLFESAPVSSLISKQVIDELMQLSQDLQVSYNIHLPTDIAISDPSVFRQNQAVDTLLGILERTAPLSATSNTLHIPCAIDINDVSNLKKWQEAVYRSLEKIISSGLAPGKLAIETLDYSLEILEDIIADLQLSICLDVGHLIIAGARFESEFNRYGGSVSIIHLHGVEDRQDHQSLNRLSDNQFDPVLAALRNFSGTVSLEIFNFENLESSLSFLEKRWIQAD